MIVLLKQRLYGLSSTICGGYRTANRQEKAGTVLLADACPSTCPASHCPMQPAEAATGQAAKKLFELAVLTR